MDSFIAGYYQGINMKYLGMFFSGVTYAFLTAIAIISLGALVDVLVRSLFNEK